MLAPDVPRGGPLWSGIADMLKRASPDILERQQHALIVRHDANDVLGNLEVPVALVVGEHDGWSTPDQHRQLAARLKVGTGTWRERGCQYVEITGGAGSLK